MKEENGNNVLYTVLNKKYPVVDHAQGVFLYDTDGKEYIDCASGIAVVNIGHGVKEVIEAIKKQLDKVTYVYGGTFTSERRDTLASMVIDIAPEGMDKVFFCSGGSEAIESVIKIARQYQLECGRTEKYKIISRWQSYHGNTIATLAVGGRPSWRAKYGPYLPRMPHIAQCNCYRCPYGLSYPGCGLPCAWELERIIKYEGPETVAAFLIEPIVGTTAVATVPPKEYMQIVRKICDKYDVLFCVDEVITGFGRTGKAFAVDHFEVVPDMIGVAKGLGSGYMPIGAVIVHKKISDAISNGTGELTHSFTFASNPVACAAGCAVLEYNKKHDLFNRSAKMGKVFLNKLKSLEDLPIVDEVRGIGMLLGVELVKSKLTKETFAPDVKISKRIVSYCFEHGVVISAGIPGSKDGISGDALQLAPPLTIEEKEMDKAVETIRDGIKEVCNQLS